MARRRLSHERRVLLLALGGRAARASLVALALLWARPYSPRDALDARRCWSSACALGVRRRRRAERRGAAAADPVATCWPRCARRTSRSARAAARPDDALGDAPARGERAGRHAARAAPGRAGGDARSCARCMEEIDVAVFAFDAERSAAPASTARASGCSGRPRSALLGRGAARARPGRRRSRGGAPRGARRSRFPAAPGRCEVRRGTFRQGGLPARAAGADRREPRAARGGAPGLAAPHPRARPRAQQLAGARSSRIAGEPGRACVAREPRPADWEDGPAARPGA